MAVQAAFLVLLMFAATVKTEKGSVTFWRDKVYLTCPGDPTKWYQGKDSTQPVKPVKEREETYEFDYKSQDEYRCEYDSVEYKFYVKGKACKNCFELDVSLFVMIITGDLIISTLLIGMIYRCSKKQSSDRPTHITKAPVKPGSRGGPPVPNPDYEMLNPGTQTRDLYSHLK